MKYLVAGFIGKKKDFKFENIIVKGTVKKKEEKKSKWN